jgi:polygalacturonase
MPLDDPVSHSGRCFGVRDYGATGDGRSPDTEALNGVIGACAQSGGGTVLIPGGRYVSGPIRLLGNVTLHLGAGAVLEASKTLDDYPVEAERWSVESRKAGLISAQDVRNVAVTGRGVIDGSGSAFVQEGRVHVGWDYDARFTRQGDRYVQSVLTASGSIAWSLSGTKACPCSSPTASSARTSATCS